MNRYFGRIVTRSESHSRQANSSTLFAVVSPGGGRSDVFDMEVFLASRRLSARSARHRCWSALERFDLRAFASVHAMPSKKERDFARDWRRRKSRDHCRRTSKSIVGRL